MMDVIWVQKDVSACCKQQSVPTYILMAVKVLQQLDFT